jgi:hypothetical protein
LSLFAESLTVGSTLRNKLLPATIPLHGFHFEPYPIKVSAATRLGIG